MELSIKIPVINSSFYDSVSAKANQDKINNVIKPKFGKIVTNIASMVGIPESLIYAFIFIESGGDANAKSPYAAGLMQLSAATASDTIVKEKGLGRLSPQESQILKKYLRDRYSLIEKVKPNETSIGKTFINNNDLMQPELNILLGATLLKQLIGEFTEPSGKVRMDKVVTIYNGGRYGAIAKKIIAFKGTTEELINLVPKETSDYVKKLIGVNSVLDKLV